MSSNVSLRRIPFGKPITGDEELQAMAAVMESGMLVHGSQSRDFEDAFAGFTGAPHAVSVASCTAALHLTYFHLGLGPGDEVIVPAETHTATAHAVELTGARPIFVDAEPATGNIDAELIRAAITPRTRAISVVHYLGLPVAMDPVLQIAREHGLFVVEDCALGIGSRIGDTHVGLLGDVGCFSFYPVKHITTAEGGMIISKHAAVADSIRRLRAYGMDRHVGERTLPGMYDVPGLGFNYRMNELEAAIGLVQMKRLPEFLTRRRANYETLTAALREIAEIELLASSAGDLQSSYYCHTVLLKDDLAADRPRIIRALRERGVGTSIYYPHPVPLMTYYRQKYNHTPEQFPVAQRISSTSIALPVGPHLDADDMRYVAESLKDAITRTS